MTSHEQDLDMEELEARLYSQVYHSNEGDSVPSAVPQPPPAAYNRPRYFNASTQSLPFYNPSYVGSNESWNQGQNFSRPETSSNPPAPNPQMPNPSNCDQPVFYDHRFGYPVNNIFINFEPRRKRNKRKNEPKVKKLSSRQRRKLQSREDKKKNKLKALEQSRERVPKIAKDQRKVLEMLRQEGKTDLLRKHGFLDEASDPASADEDPAADDSSSSEDDSMPELEELEHETPKQPVKRETVHLIESDTNSDCQINEAAAPTVVVISEDEQDTKRGANATSTDDSADVVFVEPPQKETACEDAASGPAPLLGTPNAFLDSFASAQHPDEASLRGEFEGTGAGSFSELNLDSFIDYIGSRTPGENAVQEDSGATVGSSKLAALPPMDSEEGVQDVRVPATREGLENPPQASPPRPAEASATHEVQKRKSGGDGDDGQAKKQRLHGSESGDLQVKSEQPSEDISGGPGPGMAENPGKVEGRALGGFSGCWSDDMRTFYGESWDHETFSVEEAQSRMSDDPAMWKVSVYDQARHELLFKVRRCLRCGGVGHTCFTCTSAFSEPKCILCAGFDHVDAKCPNKLCTSCGSTSQDSTKPCSGCAHVKNVDCSICSMPGHRSGNCPDLWRRYYLTTREGPLSQPEEHALKPAHDRWCCGCGSRGHFESDCYYYNRTHPPASPYIHSYDEIYPRRPQRVGRGNPAPGARKTKSQRQREKREREHSQDLKPCAVPTSCTTSDKPTSCFIRIEGVDMGELFRRRGADVFRTLMEGFPGCSMAMKEGRSGYSYTLKGPCEALARARYAVGAVLFNHVAFRGSPDLTKHFDAREDFTRDTLRKYFGLADSSRSWTTLAKFTLKKARAYKQASRMLNHSVPPETVQALRDKADKLQMSLNSVILAQGNVPGSHASLSVLREAANGAYVNAEALRRAYDHIFRNSAVEPIDYREHILLLSFGGAVKRDFEQMLALGQELCIRHDLTELLVRLRKTYAAMMRKFNRGTQCKFKKTYRAVVKEANEREAEDVHLPLPEEANSREQAVDVKAEEEHLPIQPETSNREQVVDVEAEEEHLPLPEETSNREQVVDVEAEGEHLPVEVKKNRHKVEMRVGGRWVSL